jgi:hypothetical protein
LLDGGLFGICVMKNSHSIWLEQSNARSSTDRGLVDSGVISIFP